MQFLRGRAKVAANEMARCVRDERNARDRRGHAASVKARATRKVGFERDANNRRRFALPGQA